ncbi:restriction endonuclease [Denitromonas iodatirespirans]|uniref:Restriction endonuclease n=1 Tax=Denitromonas iodatirespirans TaxID=2795389 RepID=A0A944H6H6_DENI1|nr:restriction endonuclease [Denitromonas iodatirespirans]MBT0960189.1 restriction endonuclease [Denitromonas iodatirespirans]
MTQTKKSSARQDAPRKARSAWALWLVALVLVGAAVVWFQGWRSDNGDVMTLAPLAALMFSLVVGGAVLTQRMRDRERATTTRTGKPRHRRADSEAPTIHSAPTEFDPSALTDAELSDFDLEAVPAASRIWSLSLLESLEWQRFEALCVAYYTQKSISHRALPVPNGGGRDITLYQDATDIEQATGLVHVRSRGVAELGVAPIRELIGAMTHERIARGFFMTNGRLSASARQLGREHELVLVDGRLLLAMIERLPEAARDKLHAIATEGRYTTPTCPVCAEKMVPATGSHGDYWGCRNYPTCTAMLPRLPALG